MPPQIIPARLGTGARGGFTTAGMGEDQASAGLDLALPVAGGEARANRELLAEALGVPVQWMRQVHGSEVAVVTGPPTSHEPLPEADALVADARGLGEDLAVGVLVADCVPVLLAGGDAPVVAAVHVGREGLVRQVLPAALAELERHGARLPEVYAAVGPGICGRCYEVEAELRDAVEAAVPGTASTTSWGTPAVDIAAGVLRQLADAGVQRVHHVDRCTYEEEGFYSYRRSGTTERFAGVVRTVVGD